ncbi:uncharacterized protein LOC121853788 isoform X1 [Homarus americanus]|uniref:Putative DM4/DM12 family-like protein 20 n=1 Tax=Homarus americanus TaxID=6706 RepID=A0A8J5JNH7_HOMAM|nr:uncharacterized protein LOC121853788 isoform X1 [Homarus americanus]KAG7156294.1 putative DM4/DM12 family-like protein 20 [Homarus americanus]
MASKLVSCCVLVASVVTKAAAALDIDYNDGSLYDDEGRLLVIPIGATGTGLSGLNFNITSLAALFSVLASALVTLLGLAALGFLLYSLFAGGYGFGSGSGSGYGGGSGGGGYSSYSSYRRSFDPYAIDWEKFSILDWIAIGEEAWRKFDPSDLECQKRLICEVHQNTSRFGNPAARIVDLFSYLQYAEVLSLPDEFKALIEEYNDAADRGRSLQKDCGEVYTTCDFSVKKIMDKYSHNEV